MKVELIAHTNNPLAVMYTAARTCYSATSPVDMWKKEYDAEKMKKLVQTVLKSGHQSIAEQVTFTFAIEGISRACSHQIVRHRAGIVFSQQSQRYVEIKEDWDSLYDAFDETRTSEINSWLKSVADKYFVGVTEDNYNKYIELLCSYLYDIKQGAKPEDARAILPNATKTNITTTINLRELIHICNLRLCTRAQKEIRDLCSKMRDEVMKFDEFIGSLLVPSCEALGVCQEDKCCGRKPTLKEVLSVYDTYKESNITKDDFELLMSSIDKPEVNDKLLKSFKTGECF